MVDQNWLRRVILGIHNQIFFIMLRILLCTFLLLALVLWHRPASAQFEIGQTTITFNDPDRTGGFGDGGGPGRQIQTEIYYPAEVAGENVDLANGSFPVVAFGHGFVMEWSAYANVWELLASNGYIVAFPRTEGNFSPSHLDFGLDLALVVERMQDEGADESSIFHNRVMDASAIMGHSMGGGATFIAAANTEVQAVVGLASAETNPSAISAAGNVNAPLLMFAASSDDVTPPAEHQIPIFNATASSCKYLVNITGGGHCQFANSSVTCEFGELFTSGNISISRVEQHTTMNDYLLPWLNRWLKEDTDAQQSFVELLLTDDRITFQEQCVVTHVQENFGELRLFPNPTTNTLFIQSDQVNYWSAVKIFDQTGRLIQELSASSNLLQVDVSAFPRGAYVLIAEGIEGQLFQGQFIKE